MLSSYKSERGPSDSPSFKVFRSIQLWQFLLELLTDKKCQYIIYWTEDGLEF